MFANRRNKQFKRFSSLVQDGQTIAQDSLPILCDQRKDNSNIGSTILASSVVLTKHVKNNVEIHNIWRKFKRLKHKRKDEKTEQASSTVHDDDNSDFQYVMSKKE
ncbi:MAG: hypothetical protein EZS28_023011 [Streblomastix strix]|uniref:Uncharacterized protein n=1 Tax=Streblomastix strix TaxID=222440 RepID=A0A5J4VG41_9EUKA|nr:MAG: hypothetical protein EZS28_023011 [Streblomastix strix]